MPLRRWRGVRLRSIQPAEAGSSALERKTTFVEIGEMGLIIGVQPCATGGSSLVNQGFNEGSSDPVTLMVGVDDRVKDEGVRPTVPAAIDEPDQCWPVEGADPRQGVSLEAFTPWRWWPRRVAERSSV